MIRKTKEYAALSAFIRPAFGLAEAEELQGKWKFYSFTH